jgi:hypothetical protein
MHEPVVRVFRINTELIRTGPEIAFLAEVNLALGIDEDPYSYVELPLPDKERALDILLNYEAIMFVLGFTLFEGRLELIFRLFGDCRNFLLVFARTFRLLIFTQFIDGLYLLQFIFRSANPPL